ncbi:MAG TPA: glycosyltransferase family 39 protein [Candidatus Angelobacter sp.]|nr:glycosyltransferase family 39 protein [Candidatus Angelobacter sp.]
MNEVLEQVESAGVERPVLLPPMKRRYSLALWAIAALVFLLCVVSPPALMDDVDAVHAQISRNMVQSHDWVIFHLDGVPYMEKAPLLYWMIAGCYLIFGVHDWVARLPIALAAMLLCWTTFRYGAWAFGRRAGFYAGLALATCVGLFLFTRILIPDVLLTLTVAVCFLAFQRALNEDGDERHPRGWAVVLAVSLALGVLLKGLIALVAPIGGALMYLALTRQLFVRETWRRLHLLSGLLIFIAIAAPWHIAATLRMPPYLDFSMHSGPGQYHGFFWFYFINEHVLRFLNLRYPRDYNTVPRAAFWLLNLLWLFPWSAYLPAAARFSYRPWDRSGRTRLLALCWAGFLLLFFTFSTTQEYYSMPIYPALALLLGCAMSREDSWVRVATKCVGAVAALGAVAIAAILFAVRHTPTPGDISGALQQHPEAYTLSLGHLGDLTLQSLAYLRLPLVIAGAAFLIGAAGAWLLRGKRAIIALAMMMVLFFHASRLALKTFDPYLSSRPLAEALVRAPRGQLVIDGAYYSFSSIFFYANRDALLLNGRVNNLEYGSYAPGAAPVFIDDPRFASLWASATRCYLVTDGTQLARLRGLLGAGALHELAESGGKYLFTNGDSGPLVVTSINRENKPALW